MVEVLPATPYFPVVWHEEGEDAQGEVKWA